MVIIKVQIFYTVLGQKSLSLLHRADASMIWSSYIFDKKNKWLSYNLWFIYIYFYKNIIFCKFYLKKNKKYFHKNLIPSFKKTKQKKLYLSKTKTRFSYYIDLYCIEIFESLILLNIFFFTNLPFYKQVLALKKKKKKKKSYDEYFSDMNLLDSKLLYKDMSDKIYKDFF